MFKKIPWVNPLKLAKAISLDASYKDNWAFLYSGLHKNIKQSKSYLALYPKQELAVNNFDDLELSLRSSKGMWLGYLGYGLKNKLEDLRHDEEFKINLPDLWFVNFNLVLEFNHDKKRIKCFCADKSYLKKLPNIINSPVDEDIEVRNLNSNFSKEEYLEKVQDIKDRIINGDLYQANLTRKFYGKIEVKNKFDLFLKLNKVSPSNYSTFFKLNENYIISSSPELFLKINKRGKIKSSPIKGTAPRFRDKKQDVKSKNFLRNCDKEKAENLMIVDLVRNDLSRSCKVNSVQVKNLFKVDSYKTLHHMSSDVFGTRSKKINNIDVIKNCFPPASMTGAPKIKAMEVCSDLEKVKRGVYSGAVGLITKNECKLSVVIRTLMIQDNNFEFQVGGAITHGSNPELEWKETINKAKGIAKTIGINLEKLKKI